MENKNEIIIRDGFLTKCPICDTDDFSFCDLESEENEAYMIMGCREGHYWYEVFKHYGYKL